MKKQILIAVSLLTLFSCSHNDNNNSVTPSSSGYKVTYGTTIDTAGINPMLGTPPVLSISYIDSTGNQIQLSNIQPGWATTLHVTDTPFTCGFAESTTSEGYSYIGYDYIIVNGDTVIKKAVNDGWGGTTTVQYTIQ